MVASNLIPGLQLSLRAGVAAALALVIAQFLGFQDPLYAMISAVIVTDLVPAQTRKLALPPLAGTLLGSTLGGAISTMLPPDVWVIALGILVAMFLSHLFYLQAAAKLAGYVCGIVLLNHGDAAWSYFFFACSRRLWG